MRFAQDNQQIGEFAVPEANQGVGVDAKHFYSVDNQAIGKYDKTTGKHAACTRRVSADPGACSGGKLSRKSNQVARGRIRRFESYMRKRLGVEREHLVGNRTCPRTIITADRDLVPLDDRGYRV